VKITKIETIWFEPLPTKVWQEKSPQSRQASPNHLWVRIYTDEGLIGLERLITCPGRSARSSTASLPSC